MRTRDRDATSLPAAAAVPATLLIGGIAVALIELDAVSAHMAMHIIAMNVVAPLCAIIAALRSTRTSSPAPLWLAAALQMAAMWIWHIPQMQAFAMQSRAAMMLMHASLFCTALLFWTLLLRLRGSARWQGILALVVTGKLSCLLAALLVFSPRHLFEAGHHAPSLDDQQMAGLLMLTACPVSYAVAGAVMAMQLAGIHPWRREQNATAS